MKLLSRQKTWKAFKAKFFPIILLTAIGLNLAGVLNKETPTQKLNTIIANSNNAEAIDDLMADWYTKFNQYQESGMDMIDADRKATLKALRSFRKTQGK